MIFFFHDIVMIVCQRFGCNCALCTYILIILGVNLIEFIRGFVFRFEVKISISMPQYITNRVYSVFWHFHVCFRGVRSNGKTHWIWMCPQMYASKWLYYNNNKWWRISLFIYFMDLENFPYGLIIQWMNFKYFFLLKSFASNRLRNIHSICWYKFPIFKCRSTNTICSSFDSVPYRFMSHFALHNA